MEECDADLLPCPFCGGGETEVQEETYWTGMRSAISSVSVRHWCPRAEGQLQNLFDVKAKTREGAIAKWNTRHTPSSGDNENE